MRLGICGELAGASAVTAAGTASTVSGGGLREGGMDWSLGEAMACRAAGANDDEVHPLAQVYAEGLTGPLRERSILIEASERL
jgi:hypothetical protein